MGNHPYGRRSLVVCRFSFYMFGLKSKYHSIFTDLYIPAIYIVHAFQIASFQNEIGGGRHYMVKDQLFDTGFLSDLGGLDRGEVVIRYIGKYL